MDQYFTGSETWLGGYYELAFELGERSEDRLLSALIAVWSHPDLDGIYADRELEPQDQQKIAMLDALNSDSLYGVARLPNGIKIACGTFIVREEDGPDWIALFLPMGSLEKAYAVGGYPFEPDLIQSRQWRDTLNHWLAQIGTWVYEQVKYRLGIIGMQVSGELYADDLIRSGIQHQSDTGLLWPEGGKLVYYPNTE